MSLERQTGASVKMRPLQVTPEPQSGDLPFVLYIDRDKSGWDPAYQSLV
jgi:hypothetical protein